MQPAVPAPKAVLVVDNISVSNGDHVVNGIDFLHDGRLIIAVGSQTNAGIEGALGLLPVCIFTICSPRNSPSKTTVSDTLCYSSNLMKHYRMVLVAGQILLSLTHRTDLIVCRICQEYTGILKSTL